MRTSIRLVRPLAVGAAIALVVPAAIAFAPGALATGTVDTGDATSTATVLSLTALGHNVKAVVASLGASTISKPSSAVIDVVPVNLDGTKYGEQSISSGSRNVGAQSKSVLGAVGVNTPAVGLQASTVNGPVARLTSAGSIAPSLLGLSLPAVSSTLSFGSSVVSKTSDSSKAVHISNFSLPSLKDLLGQLGLNINQLPTSTLENLVNKLNLVTSSITSAENAVTGLPAAQAAVVAKTTALTNALAAAPFGNVAVVTLLSALGISAPTTAAQWQGLTASQQSQLVNALNAVTAGTGTAINAADSALKLAQTTLQSLTTLAGTLIGLLVGALDTPLLSIGDITVGTVAKAGAQHVAQVTGSVKGVSVLGNKLIKSTDIVNLGSSVLSTVQGRINALAGTLSSTLTGSALNGIIGTLKVPAPTISLLKKSTSLSPNAGYQAAAVSVVGAAVSWGALSIPTVGIPGAQVAAAAAKSNASLVNGNLVTDPIGVTIADLTDQSRYAPAAAVKTPTTVTPGTTPTTTLPQTGVSTGVAVGALLLMLAAFGVRRMRSAAVTDE